GQRCSCSGWRNGEMRRGLLSIKEERRNRAIMRIRSLVERPFAVIKRAFSSGHTLVTTSARVHVKNLFSCFAFNLQQLHTLNSPPS
ncbi:MAG: transposase, partial [Methanomicrobiales archaeon]|nr:transposase [Methanomicrobiales archaeon]